MPSVHGSHTSLPRTLSLPLSSSCVSVSWPKNWQTFCASFKKLIFILIWLHLLPLKIFNNKIILFLVLTNQFVRKAIRDGMNFSTTSLIVSNVPSIASTIVRSDRFQKEIPLPLPVPVSLRLTLISNGVKFGDESWFNKKITLNVKICAKVRSIYRRNNLDPVKTVYFFLGNFRLKHSLFKSINFL